MEKLTLHKARHRSNKLQIQRLTDLLNLAKGSHQNNHERNLCKNEATSPA
jgi:hypothetical protein